MDSKNIYLVEFLWNSDDRITFHQTLAAESQQSDAAFPKRNIFPDLRKCSLISRKSLSRPAKPKKTSNRINFTNKYLPNGISWG